MRVAWALPLLTLAASAQAAGRDVTGTVVDADGSPVAGAVVKATCGTAEYEARTSWPGEFAFRSLDGADCTLVVSARGHLTVRVGASGSGLIRLGRARAIGGVVLRGDGTPAPGASVWIREVPGPGASGADSIRVDADDVGRFAAAGWGSPTARLHAEWRAPPSVGSHVRSSPELRIEVPPEGAAIELRLRGGVVVEGLVVDGRGAHVPGAAVMAIRMPRADDCIGEYFEAVADRAGRFRIEDLPDDELGLAAAPPASRPGYARLRVRGATSGLTLVIPDRSPSP